MEVGVSQILYDFGYFLQMVIFILFLILFCACKWQVFPNKCSVHGLSIAKKGLTPHSLGWAA